MLHKTSVVAGATTLIALGSAAAGVVPTRLRCEYAKNPLGLGVMRPRLSWVLQGDRRGELQTAYQILVARSEKGLAADRGELWDSGKVQSGQSVHVTYSGEPLASRMRAYWKVRVWDRHGSPSAYSEPAWWEMGLVEGADWSARWIAADESKGPGGGLSLGEWIWSAKVVGAGKAAFFRRVFEITPSSQIECGVLKINADNAFDLYVNGEFVGRGIFWDVPREYDITHDLRAGKNVIAVRAFNGIDPGGLRVAVRIRQAGGRVIELTGDPEWRTEGTAPAGWNQIEFDDSLWDQAITVPSDQVERWKGIKDGFGPRRSQCLRTAFRVRGEVARARAYASGLGLYELHVNGQRVGTDVFTPGWTDYRKRVQYQTYDVTSLLQAGDNAMGVVLGNGWFSGDLGWAQKPPFSQGPVRGIVQLDIEYADGGREVIVTDETWQTHPSPIAGNTFYHGETYDARAEMPGWSQAGFEAKGWTPAVAVETPKTEMLSAQRCETIQVTQELQPVAVTEPADGVYVFDFGQNAAGWVRLKVRGPRGRRVRLRFAELLKPDGQIDRANLRTAEATDYYILKGEGEEVWEPRFTYHGFRYCEVTGYPGRPTRDALVFRVVHSAVAPTGTFASSNPLLNRIWRNVVWSQRSNMHSVWTDCPQRDERLGWTGDAVAMATTACWNMEMARFFGKWMRDLADGQADDGGVPDVVPNIFGGGAGSPGWSDAVTILPWNVYQFYGDTRILEDSYDAVVGWVEYMRRHSKDDLFEPGGYGDWVAPVETPSGPIGTAHYYYATSLLARMASVLGRADDADKYARLASRIAEAFNKAHLDREANSYTGATQTANVIPLYFGLVPEDRQAAVADNVVRDIVARDHHLSTGFQGTAYLLPTLSRYGHDEVAYKLATQTSYPSWGYTVKLGATTIWELWDADRKGPEMNSRNHAALGSVGRWFFETLAGINIDPRQPGFKHVILRPTPVGDLTYAGAEYESVRGRIVSRWERQDDRFIYQVSIPANSTATVYLPGQDPDNVTEGGVSAREAEGVTYLGAQQGRLAFTIGSGDYVFAVDMTR